MKRALSERYSNDNADTLTSGMRMRDESESMRPSTDPWSGTLTLTLALHLQNVLMGKGKSGPSVSVTRRQCQCQARQGNNAQSLVLYFGLGGRGGVSSGQGQVGQVVGPYCFGPCLMIWIWPSRTPDTPQPTASYCYCPYPGCWTSTWDMVHVNKVTPSVQTRTRGGGERRVCGHSIVIVSCESRESRSTSEKRTWYSGAVGALLSS